MIVSDTLTEKYRLPLKRPWRTSKSVITERRGWLLRVKTEHGATGFGDCAPLPLGERKQHETNHQHLNRLTSGLSGLTPQQGIGMLGYPDFGTAARCAVETALLDLISQAAGTPLHHWLSDRATDRVRVNAAIGALDEGAGTRITNGLKSGFEVFKLKVGTDSVTRELELLRTISANLPATARLRLDANRAWRPDDARRFIEGLVSLPIESLEEPLGHPEPDLLRILQAVAPFDIALDESIGQLDTEQILDTRAVNRLILKPSARGGLLPSLELADRAAAAGLCCVVTSSLESAAGVWADAALASALGKSDLAHGLATANHLARDLGNPPELQGGWLMLDNRPGLGFVPYPA
ncbi:MAG: o-succinylbenzoate synthase [Gammaproteobacteria bacterium]|nr:o-succinylbenzoate synthase [Gammaproteobacteria bacterium]